MKLYNLNLSNSWFSLLLFFSMPAIGCKSNMTSNVITKDLELRDGKEQANRHILLGGKEFAQISEVGSANGNVRTVYISEDNHRSSISLTLDTNNRIIAVGWAAKDDLGDYIQQGFGIGTNGKLTEIPWE